MRMESVRGPDAVTLLARALRASATAAGHDIAIETIEERPWASATFVGTRHRVKVSSDSVPDVRSWFAALPEAELPMRGHIVADLIVEDVETICDRIHVTLTILTLVAT